MALSLTASCCSREVGPTETVVVSPEDELVVKHCYRSLVKPSWQVESWLSGGRYPVWYPLEVYVRLHSEIKDAELPKIKVSLSLFQKGNDKVKKEFTIRPEFRECQRMNKGTEVVRFEDETWGKKTQFPRLPGYWQGTIVDPYNTDRRKEGAVPLEPGDYVLIVKVQVEKVGLFELERMPIKLYKKR
jgi:hypothetical protein